MTRLKLALLLAAAAGAAALSAQTGTGVVSWAIGEAPPEVRPVISRADLLIATMQDSLLRQLHDKLQQGGPSLAIGACHIESTELTRRIARGEGIAAGFTSDRLRNPTNRARPWASALVARNAGRQARDVRGFAVDLGDTIGVLRPMAHQKICASCHGPTDRISPAVRSVLADRYPADRATGFSEGEIRGWFWVEMPKSPKQRRGGGGR